MTVAAAQNASTVRAAGTVRFRRETPLAFVADGRILRLDVREGDRVRAGQLLAALDPAAIDSEVAASETAVKQARAELSRQEALRKGGWVAQARVDVAEAAARQAEAVRDGARFRQRFARINSPSDGVVLRRLAEPGQTVAAGTAVLLVGELGPGFVLKVGLSASDVAGLRIGQPAGIVLGQGGESSITGQIVEISGRADERTGSFLVEIALPPDPRLRSGAIGVATIEPMGLPASAFPTRIAIPASALFSVRAEEGYVWRLAAAGSDGATIVRAHPVGLGRVSTERVEIRSGLAPGDRIVVRGVDRLVDGMQVSPSDPGRHAASSSR
ncbi:MAG: efflux RND transporter periplasmic adaptor subunit [Thermaurantiacus sp.]